MTAMSPIKRILILLMAFLIAGCTFFRSPGQDDCEKILSNEEMADILFDVYLLEQYLGEHRYLDNGIRDSAEYYYAGVFDNHDVSAETFEEALDCYLLDGREMDEIHEQVINRLSIMESEAEQMPDPDRVPEDKEEVMEIPVEQ